MIDAEHLARLPARSEKGLLHAFIECPKGNTHKIDLDKKLGIFRWALELPEGLTFPTNFGFIPATMAPDGDALDVLVLTGEIERLDQLRPTMLWELGVFFEVYNRLIDRKVEILEPGDEKYAVELAEKAIAAKQDRNG